MREMMRKRWISLVIALTMSLSLLCGCSGGGTAAPVADASAVSSAVTSADSSDPTEGAVAAASEMAPVEDVVEEGMVPIGADALQEGVYAVEVASSSSMFRVTECSLTVADGQMSARMTMSGTGYLYLYMGTAEEAAAASEDAFVNVEDNDGVHSFTVPVEALDAGIPCAAYSKRREKWYDRTLVFRSNSLPAEAWKDRPVTTAESLALTDDSYTVEVTLAGGSGRASVSSPARMTVEGGKATAEIIWSSPNYDYMLTADGTRLDPVNSEGNSTFLVPVTCFDAPVDVQADTTAMSTPHLIDYTLTFAAATVTPNG